jgi:hypothetical protein
MSEENVKLVREAFESFVGGDQERAARLVDPKVEFHGTVGGLEGPGRPRSAPDHPVV